MLALFIALFWAFSWTLYLELAILNSVSWTLSWALSSDLSSALYCRNSLRAILSALLHKVYGQTDGRTEIQHCLFWGSCQSQKYPRFFCRSYIVINFYQTYGKIILVLITKCPTMKEKRILETDPGIPQTQPQRTQMDRSGSPPLRWDCCLNIQTWSLVQMLNLVFYPEPKVRNICKCDILILKHQGTFVSVYL